MSERKQVVGEDFEAVVALGDDGSFRRLDMWWGAEGPPWPRHASVMRHELLTKEEADAVREEIRPEREPARDDSST